MGNIWAAVKAYCFEEPIAIAPLSRSEKMSSVGVGDNLYVGDELIKKACSMAMKHSYPERFYVAERIRNFSEVVFCFSGVWNVHDWISNGPFGETQADTTLFPSLKCIGLDEIARVNEAFQQRFKALLNHSDFKKEVQKAVSDGKQVVFTGHSCGGAIAILATVWFLEWKRTEKNPLCLTFGSPLVGDRVFNHALLRDDWSRYFMHFVMKYDIVPRVSLAPLSSIQQHYQQILDFFNPKSSVYARQLAANVPGFYNTVMTSACSVASHAACKMMGSTNLLLETVSSLIEMSPYRPAGTFVFCTGNGKLVKVRNTDVVLQLLFYSSRLSIQTEIETIAQRSINDHLSYKNELPNCLDMQSAVCLDEYLERLPLSANNTDAAASSINMILNELSLCERGRVSLRAAKEIEKQKSKNITTIESKKKDISEGLENLKLYKSKALLKQGYYDAFKVSKSKVDFEANVTRLELAGIWDEIMEMLKRYELPDNFESLEEWQDLGTTYRRIAEPLDIANYYRHNKNEDTGPYMIKGRPKRYKCTQRWLEHAVRKKILQVQGIWQPYESPESCFWADVEELVGANDSAGIAEKVEELKRKVTKWQKDKVLDDDVSLENSTFMELCRKFNPSAI